MKTSPTSFTTLILLIFTFSAFSQNPCVKIYDEMKNKYNIQNQSEFRSYVREFLSLSTEQINKTSSVSQDDFGLGGAYGAISGWINDDSYDQSSINTSLSLKRKYEKEGNLIDLDYNSFIAEVLDPQIAALANECLKITYNADVQKFKAEALIRIRHFEHLERMEELQINRNEYERLKNNGFYLDLTGNPNTEFVIAVGWTPGNYAGTAASVNQVAVSSNLEEYDGTYLMNGVKIYPGSKVMQQYVRLDENEAFILVDIAGYPTQLKIEFPAKGGGAFPLGTVVSSVLPFNEFSFETRSNPDGQWNAKTSKWAPADGRIVTGSDFAKKYQDYVPDLRGQFIRGENIMDLSRDDDYANGKDPDEYNRKKVHGYSYQDDEFEKHNHESGNLSGQTTSDGKHSHTTKEKFAAPNSRGGGGDPGNSKVWQATKGDVNGITVGGGKHSHSVSVSGVTDHRGGNESRPKNISLYYYIRVNY